MDLLTAEENSMNDILMTLATISAIFGIAVITYAQRAKYVSDSRDTSLNNMALYAIFAMLIFGSLITTV